MLPGLPGRPTPETPRRIDRLVRGCASAARASVFPLGRIWRAGLSLLVRPERLERGLTVILPGIEGQSFFAFDVAHGLSAGGVDAAVEVIDWTTGMFPLFLYHLRSSTRNRKRAEWIAERIVAYQDEYPGRPVHLIGHSGGGGIALMALDALPVERKVTTVVLLAPAVSPQFPVTHLLPRTEQGIWNFYSPLDAFFLGAGTLVFGTLDGRRAIAAGAVGFVVPEPDGDSVEPLAGPQLHQVKYGPAMLRSFHLGGHFGCVNRVFVEETIAPLLATANPEPVPHSMFDSASK